MRKIVLVADDDENDVLLLRRAFQKAGLSHTIVRVKDGGVSVLPKDKEKAETLGAHEYLVKPDTFDSWILVAKKLDEQWLAG